MNPTRSGQADSASKPKPVSRAGTIGVLMSFQVQLTDDVARDLEAICDYIDRHDSQDMWAHCRSHSLTR